MTRDTTQTVDTTKRSNKLLLDEHPLFVLPSLASTLGLNEAIVIQQLHWWLLQGKNERDGHFWVFNTYQDWQKQFPWWSADTVKRTLRGMEKDGLVVSSMAYNQSKTDRTKWYRIDYDRLAEKTSHRAESHDHEGNLPPPSGQSAPISSGQIAPTIIKPELPNLDNKPVEQVYVGTPVPTLTPPPTSIPKLPTVPDPKPISYIPDDEPIMMANGRCEPVPIQRFAELYNERSDGFPKVTKVTAARKAAIRRRWVENPGWEFWEAYWARVGASDFLTGRTGRGKGHENWQPDFDWLMQEKNFTKVTEGGYDNRQAGYVPGSWKPKELRELEGD